MSTAVHDALNACKDITDNFNIKQNLKESFRLIDIGNDPDNYTAVIKAGANLIKKLRNKYQVVYIMETTADMYSEKLYTTSGGKHKTLKTVLTEANAHWPDSNDLELITDNSADELSVNNFRYYRYCLKVLTCADNLFFAETTDGVYKFVAVPVNAIHMAIESANNKIR